MKENIALKKPKQHMKEIAVIICSTEKLNQKWMSDILHTLEGCLILYQHQKAF